MTRFACAEHDGPYQRDADGDERCGRCVDLSLLDAPPDAVAGGRYVLTGVLAVAAVVTAFSGPSWVSVACLASSIGVVVGGAIGRREQRPS